MAKFNTGADKNITLYAIGFLAVAVAGIFGVAYFVNGSGPSVPPPVANKPGGTLGTAEGNAAYNQTYQEKILSAMTQQMDDVRKENRAYMDAMRKEQENREALLLRQVEETLRQASQLKDSQSAAAAPLVEKISIGTPTSAGTPAGDGEFFGSPSDVRPGPPEVNGTAKPPEGKKSTKSEPNVPPHGFIKGKTLNGVVAVVGGPPKPILIKLTGRYQAANGFVSNLDGCIAHVEGTADLPSRRIMGKPAKMTCTFPDASTQTWDVSGYIVDEDGIEGLIAYLNDNSEKKLFGSAVGGGLNVAGKALSAAQSQTFTSPGGAVQAFTGSISQDLAGGFAQGVGSEVSKQVQDYYSSYASTLQTGGNRDVTVVFLNELTVSESGKSITSTRSTPSGGLFQ